MRMRLLKGTLVLLAAGCARDVDTNAARDGRARAGDVLRPLPHLPEPWTAGRKTAIGAYVEVSRPGRPGPFDLMDDCVPEGSVRVTGSVQFFAGDSPLGDPVALAFVHEC